MLTDGRWTPEMIHKECGVFEHERDRLSRNWILGRGRKERSYFQTAFSRGDEPAYFIDCPIPGSAC
jgi:hypothetical protein